MEAGRGIFFMKEGLAFEGNRAAQFFRGCPLHQTPISLDQITIAAPCPASWDEMIGDGQVRFCKQCERNVYNFSSMSRQEAEALIERMEGHLCASFYRRADGTIMTDDCPIGLRMARRAAKWTLGILAAFTAIMVGWVGGSVAKPGDKNGDLFSSLRKIEPFATVIKWIAPGPPPPPPPRSNEWTMGKVCERP